MSTGLSWDSPKRETRVFPWFHERLSLSIAHPGVELGFLLPPSMLKEVKRLHIYLISLSPRTCLRFSPISLMQGERGSEGEEGNQTIPYGDFNSAGLHCSYVRFEALSHAQPVASSTRSAQPQHCVSFDKSPCVISAVPVIRLHDCTTSSCGFFIPVCN